MSVTKMLEDNGVRLNGEGQLPKGTRATRSLFAKAIHTIRELETECIRRESEARASDSESKDQIAKLTAKLADANRELAKRNLRDELAKHEDVLTISAQNQIAGCIE